LVDRGESLTDVAEVVRRTLSARTRDHHLVEDLTQETLVRMAAAEHRLPADAHRAYAIVTARNLLVSHARRQSVRSRHLHRLVEHRDPGGPEQRVLDSEESAAMAAALGALGADERDLLLRHEAEGVDLATLAEEAGVSTGAVAMRLARARAELRLEFVLAFRHVELPTPRCRAVLLALSAGDRRQQEKVDAAGHLDECEVCASLAPPIRKRSRWIAGWLLVPFGEAIRRAWRAARGHPLRVAAAGATMAAVATTGRAVTQPWDAPPSPPSGTSVTATTMTGGRGEMPSQPDAGSPAAGTVAVPTTASALAPATPTRGATSCPDPVPLDQVDPRTAIGCPFASTTLVVTDVIAGEGFLATTAGGRSVRLQLVGTGVSPADIAPRQQLTVSGRIAAPPSGSGIQAARPELDLEANRGDVQVTPPSTPTTLPTPSTPLSTATSLPPLPSPPPPPPPTLPTG
jgi:serine/threonine-protein kinase RsbT